MKQNSIKQLPKLKRERYENIFNVYTDDNNFYYYNILQNISFPQNLPTELFTGYKTVPGDSWPVISNKIYGSIGLWWVLLLANNIKNPIEPIVPGTTLVAPNAQVLQNILDQINKRN